MGKREEAAEALKDLRDGNRALEQKLQAEKDAKTAAAEERRKKMNFAMQDTAYYSMTLIPRAPYIVVDAVRRLFDWRIVQAAAVLAMLCVLGHAHYAIAMKSGQSCCVRTPDGVKCYEC